MTGFREKVISLKEVRVDTAYNVYGVHKYMNVYACSEYTCNVYMRDVPVGYMYMYVYVHVYIYDWYAESAKWNGMCK